MKKGDKFPRLRSGRNKQGSWLVEISLDKNRKKFFSFVIGKPKAHFLALIVRASADVLAVGGALWFLQASLAFRDDAFADKPVLEYGIFIKRGIAIYFPQRYQLMEW